MKRFFKIAGLIILILFAGFISIGFFVPEVKYGSEITVNKPVEETFALFNNIARLHEWIPEIIKIEFIDLKPGITGSTLKMLVEHDGEKMEMVETITAYEPNKLVSLEFVAGGMLKSDHYEFSGNGNSTTIKANYRCRGSNIFFRSLFSFFTSYFLETDQNYLNNFKKLAETESPNLAS